MRRGLFITFEGLDGSGKTTQITRLAAWLKKHGYSTVITRQPGGTATGDRIRALVLDSHSKGLAPRCEMALMFADRAQAIAEVIKPALAAGKIVLCDRFTDSTEAYQGGGRGIPRATVVALNRFATGGLKPDLTLFFDLPPEEGFRRLGRRPRRRLDRLEVERAAFYRRVRRAYLDLAEREPGRVKRIAALGTPEEVEARVVEVLEGFLRRRGFLRPRGGRAS